MTNLIMNSKFGGRIIFWFVETIAPNRSRFETLKGRSFRNQDAERR